MNPAEFENGPGTINPYEGLPCYQPASLPPTIEYTDDILRSYGDARYQLLAIRFLYSDFIVNICRTILSCFRHQKKCLELSNTSDRSGAFSVSISSGS